jgi:polyhydroxyalkanoate synthesis regulator phasin
MDGRTLLKRYDQVLQEAQFLRTRNRELEQDLRVSGPALYRADQKIDRLEQRVAKLAAEKRLLQQRIADLTLKLKHTPKPCMSAFVIKANVVAKGRKRPGRRAGHVAALRPMPEKIDVHQEVPVPIDSAGKPSCPHCRTQLADVQRHQRVVEDIVPSKVITTCYHTTSGYCPGCRRVVESRATEQPPAADLPHAQLGLNTLATAGVMRVCYRLPLRQIARFFAQLPGLQISPGAIVKQIKRLGKWLGKQYDRLKLALRLAGVVHADETGWRTNGQNGHLWTLTNAHHTLYHVDRSRAGPVIVDLLGKAFGADGQVLVSDFYGVYDQFDAAQQKCLVHLLRELRETLAKRPELAGHAFFTRCKRLVQDMLRLKKRRDALGKEKYARQVKQLEDRLATLARCTWNDADADRLTARLKKHEKKLTTFLHHAQVDGTNNAAERALRPAVVMRKITGGSRGTEGAKSWAILASVLRTAEQQGRDVVETIKTLLRAEWEGKDIALLTDSS